MEVSIRNRNRGFTLIEVMIVLAIVGGIIAIGMPYLSSRNTKTKAVLRELTVLSRELHTKAKLQGAVYRLVIELGKEGEGDKAAQAYWVERAKGTSVIKPNEEEAAMERAKETDEKKRADPRGFELDKSVIKKPRELPGGMRFEKVELTRSKKPIQFGRAYIHFMPQGLVDEAAIHIKGEKTQAWTISIHPLTGKAEVIQTAKDLKDITSQ